MHGYLSNGKAFNRQIEGLKNQFECFSPDLVGFGENKYMAYPYSLQDYANSVKKYMEENNIVKPFVVAHSFGARIAIKMASQEDVFSKMVLTGAAGLKPKKTIKKRIKIFWFNILKKFVKKEKLKGFYSSDYNSLTPVMQESFKKIVNEHLDDNLKSINQQVLLIFGEKDRETPLDFAKRFNAGIKNSKLKIFKGAGHFCFLDKPLTFNMEVREFFLSK